MENQLSTWPHITVLLLTAVLCFYWVKNLKSNHRIWTVAVVLAPVPFLFFLETLPTIVFGKEGLIEAITEGMLLWMIFKAIVVRQPWIIFAALFIFLEEIDYGQLFFFMPTPDWLLEIPGNRSQTMNFHNISGWYAAWTLLPTFAIFMLSFDRFHQKLAMLKLPRFQHATWQGFLATLLVHEIFAMMTTMSADSYMSVASNELCESTLIVIVILGWRSPIHSPVAPKARTSSLSD